MFDWLEKLTLKDLIQLFKSWFVYLLKKWYVLLLFVAFGAGYGYWSTYKILPTYAANITFVLSTETKSASGGLGGLAAQFGLDAGAGGNENVFSGDNIIELFKTRKIAERALLQKIDGTNLCFAEYIHEKIKGNKPLALGSFPSEVDSLSTAQLAIVRKYSGLLSKSISVYKKDKKLSYYTITANGTSEAFTYFAANLVLKETSEFFIETKTKVARKNLALLEKEADSLYNILGGTVNQSANITDKTFNINPSLIKQRAPVQMNQARLTALGAAYTEVMRQLEVAKINIQKETPLYQVIDEPVRPLFGEEPPILWETFKFGIIGIALSIIGLMVKFYWKDIQRTING